MPYKKIILITNKKINYNYIIKNKYNAGIVLKGWEVKSIRKKKIQIINSYVIIKRNELFLIGMLINPLFINNKKLDSSRTRKLLLKKMEIKKIIEIRNKYKISIVPIKCFLKNQFIKIELAIVKGKTKYDKRNILKEKYWKKNPNY